jgi:DNA-binding transcriptional LysR family regulator
MNWDKLRIFHVVAETGSFTRAGGMLNLSQSAVSRQIRGLEESLKLTLFHRHARGLLLTEQGEVLFQTVHDVFAKLAMTEARLTESKERPKGPLRITTTVGFGSLWLTEQLGEFLDLYPDITVSLLVADVELDLTMREADVAVRVQPPTQPDLIQRHLFTGHLGIYAAPSYLNRFGTPASIEELTQHRVISFGLDMPSPFVGHNWLVNEIQTKMPDFEPSLTVNNLYGMLRSVQNGFGIATLPLFLSDQERHLVRILDGLEIPSADAYFVYPSELKDSQRITVFRDFLLRKVRETSF